MVSGSPTAMTADSAAITAAVVNVHPKPCAWSTLSPRIGPTAKPTKTATEKVENTRARCSSAGSSVAEVACARYISELKAPVAMRTR